MFVQRLLLFRIFTPGFILEIYHFHIYILDIIASHHGDGKVSAAMNWKESYKTGSVLIRAAAVIA